MNNYINYHNHTSYSNISTPDSTISNKDRTNRAVELQQTALGYVEHGWAGRVIDAVELSKKNNIKAIIGSEVYFVKNRLEKDKTNAHLILLAKNENGRKALNKVISEANISGFYYKARTDFDLILSLPAKDIWCTTACIGGIWKYEDHDDILMMLYNHFKNNFFLEVQTHNVDRQKEINKRIIQLSNQHNIKIVAGMDSHMVSLNQVVERDNYLLSRGISYPEEDGWFLDYPSYETAFERFKKQGILNNIQIAESLDNTNIFNDVEEYNSKIFDKDIIKLPTLYPNRNQDEKNKILQDLIWKQWDIEKYNVNLLKWSHYEEEIRKELEVVFKTNMADYFLLDYEVIKTGKELGGSITMTGRGSAPSYFLSKLLGFTTVDRISASVKLFPERFISAERLLESKGIPDIDFNLGTPEIFAKAQELVMGEGHSYSMIAFGTVRILGAWKMYARISGVDFETANNISDQVQKYEMDYKHAETEEEKEELDVLDYIDEKYRGIFKESFKYLGLINSILPHPCASLLYSDNDIREEFGLIKIKTGNTEHICACCDGYFAEDYKLLKNDLLKVSVVDLIYRTYEKIGVKPHPLPELINLCDGNQKVWDIYKNAWTMGINQVEQPGSSGRVAKYAPKNISELSAFVAAVRPGFKSNFKQFQDREHFSYGIKTLDNLIQTSEFPESYMLYQENAMSVMAYSGIPIAQTYEIIKNIAKKRVAKVLKYKEQFLNGMKKKLIETEKLSIDDAKKIADMTWQIIEDSSRYQFNASHSYSVAGDSLYGAYLKAYYPLEFYETFLRMMEDDGDKDRLAKARDEAERAFHIKFPQFKFGQDNRQIVMNKETNSIMSSLKTIKGFGNTIGNSLYELAQQDFTGKGFLDLLIYAEDNDYLSSKFESLIKINYFDMFGKNKKLYEIYLEFTKGKNRYNKKLTQKSKDKRVPELKLFFETLPNEGFSFKEQLDFDSEILGYTQSTFNVDKRYVYITEVDEKYAPRISVYNLQKGTTQSLKIQKRVFGSNPIKNGQIVYCKHFEKKPSVKFVNGQYEETEDYTWWLSDYFVVKDFDKIKES